MRKIDIIIPDLSKKELPILKECIKKTSGNINKIIVLKKGKEVPPKLEDHKIELAENLNIDEILEKAAPYFLYPFYPCKYAKRWDEKIINHLEIFKDITQISLYGPVPEDGANRIHKSKEMIFKEGEIIYLSPMAIPYPSVYRTKDIKRIVKNNTDFSKLPYLVDKANLKRAWFPHYLCRRSHSNSKRFPIRESFLFDSQEILPEITPPTKECKNPRLWSMIDGWTAEVEVLEFIHSIVRLVKPRLVVETGTWLGYGAISIGKALEKNNYGSLITIEYDKNIYEKAKENISNENLSRVKIVNCSSLNFKPSSKIDLLICDSAIDIRGREIKHFEKYLSEDAIIIFHDTSRRHKKVRLDVKKLMKEKTIEGIFINTPRGVSICKYIKGNEEKKITLRERLLDIYLSNPILKKAFKAIPTKLQKKIKRIFEE